MNTALGIAVAAVWLIAVYAAIRVFIAWLGIFRLAPDGARLRTMLDLGYWNFPAVRERLGDASSGHIGNYRQGFLIFFSALGTFLLLAIVRIVSGQAA